MLFRIELLNISSKEFLNELVRRFPEVARNVTQTQRRILELLAEWNLVYAKRSRYCEDFRHITEMCNLLEYKGRECINEGYRIPTLAESDVPQLEPEFVS